MNAYPSTRDADASNITARLRDAIAGDPAAWNDITRYFYDDLQFIAHRHLLRERQGHTLNTQGLVHEAYLKLVHLDRITWANRTHFLATASRLMRHILVTYATRKHRQKRGGKDLQRVDLEDVDGLTDPISDRQAADVLAVHEALEELGRLNERHSQIVECRFFGGLTIAETAEAMGISPATVKREWTFLKSWLARHLTAP
ncbi:MAG: ECF-type sigma factor [Rhodothermales bacterium]